uniref:Ovule protein n=1 Tax=Ascaris lumbricoides TaxID=6252 RepID=A0A0M3HUR4_ASCLU
MGIGRKNRRKNTRWTRIMNLSVMLEGQLFHLHLKCHNLRLLHHLMHFHQCLHQHRLVQQYRQYHHHWKVHQHVLRLHRHRQHCSLQAIYSIWMQTLMHSVMKLVQFNAHTFNMIKASKDVQTDKAASQVSVQEYVRKISVV